MISRIRLTFIVVVLTYIFERQKADTCPKVKCDEKQIDCANHYTGYNGDVNNILNGCTSLPNQECPINSNFLFQTHNQTLPCQNKTIDYQSRYPGEPCGNSYKCIDNTECLESTKTCFIKASSDSIACDKPIDCGVGKHCNSTDNKCHNLRGENEKCDSTFDCINGFLCNLGKCIRYFSLDPGVVTGSSLGCKYNKVYKNSTDSKEYCDKMAYNPTPNQVIKDGLISCNKTMDDIFPCKYVGESKNAIFKQCECGYNPNGESYCPVEDTSKTAEVYALMAKTFDNKCHKLKESRCDLDLDDIDTTLKTNKKNLITQKMDVLDRNLYYKADSCVRLILGGEGSSYSDYVFFSAAVLTIMALFTF